MEEAGQTEEGDENARKKQKEEESALALEKIPKPEGTGTLNRATSVTGPYGSIPVGLLDRSSELLFPYGEVLAEMRSVGIVFLVVRPREIICTYKLLYRRAIARKWLIRGF